MFSTLALGLIVASSALGQRPAAVQYEWHFSSETPNQANLFIPAKCHGTYCTPARQIGSYSYLTKIYRSLSPQGEWSAPTTPPVAPPPNPTPRRVVGQAEDEELPTGVIPEKLHNKPWASINGRQATMDDVREALAAAGGPSLEDDTSRPHLTCFVRGVEAKKQTLADLRDVRVAPMAAKARVQVYDVTQPYEGALADVFAPQKDDRFGKGQKVCWLQEPAKDSRGKVIARIDDWEGPGELGDSLRKAPIDWDPNTVPNQKTPPPPAPAAPTQGLPGWMLGSLGLGSLFLLYPRR